MSEPEQRRPKELGRLFIERGLISEEQLREALAESQRVGGLLGRVLIDLGYVTDADLVRAAKAKSAKARAWWRQQGC